ncbi:SDR family oxidoreductase [Yinghuangia seranimata]|uniref:SDR family oxidoreductase n=1 Tax=Yinghuangia seranimata TaxID=408067 RepID=UPI00248CBB36|nr:SDR family oxidoreductase [Yinghuangia seranimata]MDI2130611.1 SDR family oxidoreductase [Yinghuangia seranimata]
MSTSHDNTSGAAADSSGPVTLITGGSTGIGAATVKALLAAGHRVAVTGRSEKKLDALLGELGAGERLVALPGDAADWAAVSGAVAATVEAFGRLDNAVSNAGFSVEGNVETADPDGMRDMVLTNVLGPSLLIKAALPLLRETKGRIVLVGSSGGLKHSPGNLYSATKWAVTALAENTRMLATQDGVGVTLIAPGRVLTPFWEDRPGGAAAAGPMLTAEQIADTIVWAVSQPQGVDVNTVQLRPTGQAH